MFWTRTKELVGLINSFQDSISKERLEDILSYVEYDEFGLAVEMLSDMIYDSDVAVNERRQHEIISLSKHFGVDENYHKFIGKTPPYPDLRTEVQKNFEFPSEPSIEAIRFLAANGQLINAVKMHRELFGTSLEEAVKMVKDLESN